MQQELSERLIWVLAADALGDELVDVLHKGEIDAEHFQQADALVEALDDAVPAAIVAAMAVWEHPGGLEALVARVGHDGPPIVVSTADASPMMRRRLFKAGVADFIVEPLVPAEVLHRVQAALAGCADAPARVPSAPARRAPPAAPADASHLSVLVADSEPMVQRVLRAAFERRGWTVHAAADGREAMQLARTHGVDLVVLELNLPFKNGFELLGELGGATHGRRPHMVVASAETRQQSVLRAFELGADDFVSKPVDPDVLVARIERLVRPAIRGRY